jgi:O-antigen ligase
MIREQARDFIARILPWMLGGFIVSIGFPLEINRVFLAVVYGLTFLLWLTERPIIRKEEIWRIYPLAFFLIIALSCFFSTSNTREAYKVLDKNLPFILLPLFWPYGNNPACVNRTNILRIFVYGLLLSSLILLIMSAFKSISFINGEVLLDTRIVKDERIDFNESITWGGNHFFSRGLSVFIHPTYLTMYLTFAVFILLEYREKIFRRNVRYAAITLILVMIYLLSSRAGYLFLVSSFLIYIPLKFRNRLNWKNAALILFGISVTAGLLFFLNPRLKELVTKIRTEGFTLNPKSSYSYESRLLTWSSGVQLIKENPLFGAGAGDSQDMLLDYYKANEYTTCYLRKYNVHNQFLETWLAEGIPGLLILMLLFANFLNAFLKRREVLPVFFILMFVANCLVESAFDRYSGIVLFIFFYCLFFSTDESSTQETT